MVGLGLPEVLQRLRPGAAWVVTGGEDILWLDEVQSQPTDGEVEAMLATMQDEQPWIDLRSARNELLRDCDWTDLPNAPLEESKQEEWQAYRPSLRDLPQHGVAPELVIWPDIPEE